MQSALWKIAALVSVIGIGGFVVVKVHDQLQLQTAEKADPSKFPPPDGGDDTGLAPVEQHIAGFDQEAPSATSDPFGMPLDDQSEPANGGSALRFANAGNPVTESPYSTPESENNATYNPFQFNAVPENDSSAAEHSPPDQGAGGYDPFAGAELAADDPASTGTASAAPLTTADASFPGGAQYELEPVAATGSTVPGNAPNPFLGFGAESKLEPPTADNEDAAQFGGLVLPTEQAEPETGTQPAFPAEPATLPELAFDQSEPVTSGDPFGGAGGAEPFSGESAPSDAAPDQFGWGFDAPPGDDAGPTFDLGEPAAAGVEPAFPEAEPATAEPPAKFLPQEPPTSLVPESPTGLPPSQRSQFEPLSPGADEPSRLPAAANDSSLPRTAVRPRDSIPLAPPPAGNLPEVRPLNPAAVPRAPGTLRPEFIGDGTLGANAPAGPQQPELTIQKLAPPNATVGDPLVYAIKVKNVGNSAAHDVIVEDKIPRGTTLEGSIPQAELVDKKLIWQLGQMEPGDEKTIRIKVVPTEPGEVGSVATVRFVAEVAATTKITTPSLTMDVEGPGEVAVGEQAVFHFRIANTGDGEARNVYIRNLLPDGLEHPGGHDIEYEVGSLKPGESRAVDLAVTAAQEGTQSLRAQLNTGATVRSESTTPVNVIRSRLLIQRHGPKRRFVGRPADYQTQVSNRSSIPLRQVEVVEKLPAGMELAAAPDGGHFDPQRRTITWRIAELPPGGAKTLKTSVIASQQGTLQGQVRARDGAGNQAQLSSELEVAGFASLKVDLEHEGRPVGVGESVAMQLTVKNRGTGAAENVEALFEIPAHLTFVNAEGPVEFELGRQGRTIKFAAINELAANEEQTFKIMLTAAAPGNTPVTAQLSTADLAGPLQQAEAVIVEADSP